MHPVKEKVAHFARENGLFEKGDRILVAVSGGIDSVVLLHILTEPTWCLELKAVYVHHGLRPEADDEAEWVCQYAKRLGVQAEVQRIEVRKNASLRGESIQMAARHGRYRALEAVATSWIATRIALAHHANDQAETVLLRLLTGASPEGLGGMAPARGKLIRPMLDVYRTEILTYAKEQGLEWREDRSNQDTHYLRNRIRLELLPSLEQIQPRVIDHLTQLATLTLEWRQWQNDLLHQTEDSLDWLIQEDGVSWSATAWQSLAAPLQRAVLKKAFYRLYPEHRLEYSHQSRIMDHFRQGRGSGKIQLPGGGFLIRTQGRMFLQRETKPQSKLVQTSPVEVQIPGETPWYGGVFYVKWISRSDLPMNWRNVGMDEAYFAMPQGVKRLYLRSRKAGDRMVVFGRTQMEKVKKLMIDAKVSRMDREVTPILVDENDKIWWVVGVRHGEMGRIQPGDDQILHFKYIRIPDDTVR